MATSDIGWAPANPWFKPGIDHVQIVDVGDVNLKILTLPYFIASKLAAFHSRSTDPRTSSDLEDVIYILDNRDDYVHELKSAPDDVKVFLIDEFRNMLQDKIIIEAIMSNFEFGIQGERFALLREKLNAIISD